MNANRLEDIESNLFSGSVRGNLAVIRLKQGLMIHVADLKAKDQLLGYVDAVARHPDVSVILILGTPEKTGPEEYIEFYRRIIRSGAGFNHLERLYNAVNQFVLKTISIDKFVLSADQGRIISVFLNLGLACDFRLVADNARFEHPYLELGLVPKGGGCYFLSTRLGPGVAYKFLLSKQPISAAEALEIGIVDKVVPLSDLESAAMDLAREFAAIPATTLSGIKRLVNHDRAQLQKHLEEENEILRLIIRNQAFLDRLAAVRDD